MAVKRLIDLMTISTNTAQAKEQVLDLGSWRHNVFVCRKPVAATTGTITIQHAAENDDAAFIDAPNTFNLGNTTTEVITYDNSLSRFVRWKSTSVTGSGQLQIDVVSRQRTDRPLYRRLQDITTASALATQAIDQAVDVSAYKTVVFVGRVAEAASAGVVWLQTAAVLDDAAFANTTGSISLTATGNTSIVVTDIQRYVRWSIPSITGTAKFQLDLVGRDH
jgi:hypothetical protein